AAVVEVGRIERAAGDRKALVDRAVAPDDSEEALVRQRRRWNGRAPAADRPALGREQELRGPRIACVVVDDEVGPAVEDGAGRTAFDADDERSALSGAGPVIERRRVRP